MQGYLGEIQIYAGSNIPQGWVVCDGRSMPIVQNQALYAVLGNTYGATSTTFNLPDLRGRVPCGVGVTKNGRQIKAGQLGGSERVALKVEQIPAHSHNAIAMPANASLPPQSTTYLAQPVIGAASVSGYVSSTPNVTLGGATVTPAGSSVPHENMQPYTVVNYIICISGLFPAGESNDTMGMVKLFAGKAPDGYMPCVGTLISVRQNQALFSIMGTSFGGDGKTDFGMPNLQAAVPLCWNMTFVNSIGGKGGASSIAINESQTPQHTHSVAVNQGNGSNNVAASGNTLMNPYDTVNNRTGSLYANSVSNQVQMSNATIGSSGLGQPHDNMQPYLGLIYYICIAGTYPTPGNQ